MVQRVFLLLSSFFFILDILPLFLLQLLYLKYILTFLCKGLKCLCAWCVIFPLCQELEWGSQYSVLTSGRIKRIVFLQDVQTGSGAHPSSYQMDIGGSSWGQSSRSVRLTTHLHLESRLRKTGTVLSFSLTCLCGLYRDNFNLPLLRWTLRNVWLLVVNIPTSNITSSWDSFGEDPRN